MRSSEKGKAVGGEGRQGLSRGLATAWGVKDRPGKGPKPGLSLERIVAAAVQVAETEGLSVVSMGRVATVLGAGTMALYRYVESKEELLMLMMDAAFCEHPPPPAPEEPWQVAVERWARQHLAVLRKHPWVVRIPLGGPPITPNQVVWFERGLSSLSGTGLPEMAKLDALALVNGWVRHEAMLEADLREAERRSGRGAAEASASYWRTLGGLIDAQRFPTMSALVAAATTDAREDDNAQFTFGLERILDGITQVAEHRSPRRRMR